MRVGKNSRGKCHTNHQSNIKQKVSIKKSPFFVNQSQIEFLKVIQNFKLYMKSIMYLRLTYLYTEGYSCLEVPIWLTD